MSHVPTGWTRLVVATVAGSSLLAGCGAAEVLPGDGVDDRRMRGVAADEDATPAEVVQAGRAVDAARSDGTVLVAYTVHGSSDEGRSAAAWRLYDLAGDPVAEEHAGVTEEGSAHPDVVALPDGFLVEDQDGPWWHVTTDGVREPVTRVRRPAAERPGDVPLGDGSPRLFRPATRTLFTAAPAPTRHWQGWVSAADGSVWMQEPARNANGPVRSRRSAGGRPWESVASYDPGRGRTVAALALTAVGDRIVVPLLAQDDPSGPSRLVGLLARKATAPADQPWKVLDPPDADADADDGDWWDVRVAAVDATTALVGTWGSEQHVLDLVDGGWRAMPGPTDEHAWSYEAQDGRIYATHFDHADAWFTDDLGTSWHRLPH